MSYYSPLVERLTGDGAAAWDIHYEALAAQARGEDIILLSVGDPDLDTPPEITERAVDALRDGQTHYTPPAGCDPLRAAVAAEYDGRLGWPVGPENVAIVAGAQNGLFFASLLCLAPGDEVLTLDPMYVTYEATIRASGAELVPVPPRPGGGFRPDPERIAAAVTPRSRAIWLTTPNNPTGVALSRAELEAIAEIARRHDLWVIADEVYGDLVLEGEHVSIAGLPGMAERTVTIASLSKTYAMTGWRIGWILGPPALTAHASRLALCMLYGLPGFIQEAALTALTEARGRAAEMREIFRRRRDRLLARLDAVPGLTPVPPQLGMFLMVDIRKTGLDGAEFARGLLAEQGVSVLDGAAFGPSAQGHIRLSCTVDGDRLEAAADRIARFCAARQPAPAASGTHG